MAKVNPNVLVVLAHPDDETWMSGSIAMLAQKKYQIHVLYITSGEGGLDKNNQELKNEELGLAREKEAINALEILGVPSSNLEFLRFPNAQRNDIEVKDFTLEVTKKIQGRLETLNPEVVITFGEDGITGHQEHKIVNKATKQAIDGSEVVLLNFVLSDNRYNELIKMAADTNINLKTIIDHLFHHKTSQDRDFLQAITKDLQHVNLKDFTNVRQKSMASHETQFPKLVIAGWQKFVASNTVEDYLVIQDPQSVSKVLLSASNEDSNDVATMDILGSGTLY